MYLLLLLVETTEWRRAAAQDGVALVFALRLRRRISSDTTLTSAPDKARKRPSLNNTSSRERRIPPIARSSDAMNLPLKKLNRIAEPVSRTRAESAERERERVSRASERAKNMRLSSCTRKRAPSAEIKLRRRNSTIYIVLCIIIGLKKRGYSFITALLKSRVCEQKHIKHAPTTGKFVFPIVLLHGHTIARCA